MPIDGIRGNTLRYDHQDDERMAPPKKEHASPEARQAHFIASEHALVRFKQNIAAKHPDYVAALNRGDVRDVAAVLAKVHYASAPDAAYAAGMARAAKTIGSKLGPAS